MNVSNVYRGLSPVMPGASVVSCALSSEAASSALSRMFGVSPAESGMKFTSRFGRFTSLTASAITPE